MIRTAILAGLVTVSGCAFASVERLPSGYQRQETPRCQETKVPLLVDGVLTAFAVSLSVYGAAHGAPVGPMAVSGGAAVAGGSSLWWGWRQRHRCERARDDHDEWLRAAPLPEGPPGTVSPGLR